jgi:hypothetical protein
VAKESQEVKLHLEVKEIFQNVPWGQGDLPKRRGGGSIEAPIRTCQD